MGRDRALWPAERERSHSTSAATRKTDVIVSLPNQSDGRNPASLAAHPIT